MKEKDNGGPAYPHTVIGDLGQTREVCEGMMMRDYFAGLAMQASPQGDPWDVAKRAYKLADAMLAERSKP